MSSEETRKSARQEENQGREGDTTRPKLYGLDWRVKEFSAELSVLTVV